MDREIVCITRNTQPPIDCTCITYVGVEDSEYLVPVSEVIKLIEGGKNRFYIFDFDHKSRIYVVVAQREQTKYIRTSSDDKPNDNLLKIGDCKVAGWRAMGDTL